MTISEEILVNITPQETRVAIVENGDTGLLGSNIDEDFFAD